MVYFDIFALQIALHFCTFYIIYYLFFFELFSSEMTTANKLTLSNVTSLIKFSLLTDHQRIVELIQETRKEF